MFKSKRDVDRHVTHVTNRIRDVKERHARGFQFAKLYYEVSDYESGKRYLQEFLKIRETVPQAHKLMGQICEALHDKKTALDSYKRSLDLDPDQTELVLKVCELYCDPSVQIIPDNAKLWVERAEKHYPGHYTIFRLKERVIDKDNEGDPGELERLINTELTKNPGDVKLHIRLLKLYIHSREVDKAYEHAVKTEKKLVFVSCMDWYECLVDVYQVYQDQHGCGDDALFYMYKLFAVCMLTSLRLQTDDRDMLSAIKSLNQLDQDLNDAQAIVKKSTEWESFLTEMKGQLFFLTAVLLLKRAQKGQLPWKDASSYGAVCFLLSNTLPAIDQKSSWFCQLSQERRRLYDCLKMLGCDRLSQGGHIIHSLVNKQDESQWARKLQQKVCTVQGCETLYNIIFTDGEMRKKKDNSFLLKSKIFTESSLDVPAKSSLLKYDCVASSFHTDSLNHLVWLALRYHSCKDEVQQDYEQLFQHQLFPNMKFGMQDLSGGDPGTLCQLDVQVFLYVCVRWVAMQQKDEKRNLHPIPDKPDLVPVCLSNNICTRQQTEWWTAMYKLQTSSANEKLAKLFGTVSRGLETLRLVTPHTMPLTIIVHIARTLDRRVEEMESYDTESLVSPRLNAVQQRAAFYWKCAEEMLERIDKNFNSKQPKEMLFPSPVSTMDPAQIREMREQIKFARACVAMREERYEEALSSFESLPQAKAAYYTGMVYRKLYESLDINTNSAGGGTNSQQTALLSKAKNALYQALDRLESENNQDLKEAVKEELDGIVCKLISLESGGAVVDSFLSNQSQAYSTAESDVSYEEEPLKQPKTPLQSTPGKSFGQVHGNPSPTRIEVQFKALESTNTAFSSRLSSLEETVQTNRKLILELFTQLRESRDENRSLREQIQILSFQGLSNINMSLQRPSLGQSVPGTPHQRSMLNVVNSSFGAAPPTYDYPVPTGIPPHLSQYGYTGGSPRPGSAYGQPNFEDELNNIDGEFFDPDTEGECYIPDQNLVQEWPFGHKTGVEGKSTITYSPQHVGKGLGQTNPGVFANALRGQSIQYGAYQQPLQPAVSQMPGPGYFSQNNQQMVPPAIPTQSSIYPNTNQMGMMMNATGASSLPPSLSPKVQGVVIPRPATTTMMPPNAVMSSTVEAKPKLIPGSVGIPPPNTQTMPPSQPVISAPPALSSAATIDQKGKTQATIQGIFSPSTSRSTDQATTISVVSSAPSFTGQSTPGSAASMLSQLAGKQQQQVSPAQTTPQKTVFKGFSFSSTPKITEPKSDNSEKENINKTTASETLKPFSGFAFSVAKTSAPGSSASNIVTSISSNTPQTQSSGQHETGAGVIFGKNASPASFGTLSAQGAVASAFKGIQDSVFSGAGLPVFGKSPSPRRRDPSAGSDDNVEEYEPTVDFKPVVPLPELIEVKTGEEDEEKLFVERAKLFRFDMDTNQWKERGIGEMKILKHKEKIQFRLLMRREQVLKLCANHLISTSLKLTPMASSDKAWVWSAADFSEGEMKQEKFAAKFKTADKAAEFKTVFEKCQNDLKKSTESKPAKTDTEVNTDKVNSKETGSSSSQDRKDSLADMFKPKPGSWTCDVCFVQNGPEVIKCPCCGALKPGASPEQIKAATDMSNQTSSIGGFKFGSLSTGQGGAGFKFGTQAVTSLSNSGTGVLNERGSANEPAMPQSTFKFGSVTASSSMPNTSKGHDSSKPAAEEAKNQENLSDVFKPKPGGFKFGSSSMQETATTVAGFKIGSSEGGTSFPSSTDPKQGYVFGSSSTTKPQGSGFVFGVQSSTTSASSSAGSSSTKLSDSQQTKTPVQTASTDAGSAGFNVSKNETKYTFGTASVSSVSASKGDSLGSGNSLLAKYLTSPESWNCYKCGAKLEGLTDFCSLCNVTRDESLEMKTDVKSGSTSEASSFAFANKGASLFNIGKSVDDTNKDSSEKGFNFGKPDLCSAVSPAKPSEGFKFSFPPASNVKKTQPPAEVGSGFNFSLSLTKLVTDTTPTKSTAQISSITSPKSPDVSEEGYYVNKEGDDSHIYFEPVVPLPPKVEVKLGEEDEEVIFTHRAKLYRFFKGEWKERGLGNVKVLFDAENKKARLVMRRDAILKICCNHYITPDIHFKPMPNSNNCALIWYAMDFSEGEGKTEQFSIKFKSADIVSKFEAAIQEVKDRLNDGSALKGDLNKKTVSIETMGGKETLDSKDMGSSVGAEGNQDVIIVKVETATEEQIEKARALQLPDHFYLYETLPDCQGCRGCDDNWSYEAELAQYDEGEEEAEEDDEEYDSDEYEDYDEDEEDEEDEEENEGSGEETGFVFGTATSGISTFASLAKTSPNNAFGTDNSKPFQWEGAGKQLFGAGAAGDEDSDGEGEVQQGDDPHFAPVVPLPDLIEVKTGEENETPVFSQRAKLFRFDKSTNQWKEKGIGDMKILKHKETGKYRLLLRREQVHKLACNHLLTPSLVFRPMNTSETSWCWTTQDFSEPEGRVEQLALKFKNIDLAKAFKDKVDEIQAELSQGS